MGTFVVTLFDDEMGAREGFQVILDLHRRCDPVLYAGLDILDTIDLFRDWEIGSASAFGDAWEEVGLLQPGKFAVVAEVCENQTVPRNSRMKKLGGTVFRKTGFRVAKCADVK